MSTSFNLTQFGGSFLSAFQYIPQTLLEAFVAFALALIIGFVLALIRICGPSILNDFILVVFSVIKSIPVYLLFISAGMIYVLAVGNMTAGNGMNSSSQNLSTRGVVSLVLTIAYLPAMSEALRGALRAVPLEQYEAAESVGLTYAQTLRRVVVPQMVPEAVPAITNILLTLVKDSSLGFLIGAVDILNAALSSAARSYSLLEAYVAAALVYWGICSILEYAMHFLQKSFGKFKVHAV